MKRWFETAAATAALAVFTTTPSRADDKPATTTTATAPTTGSSPGASNASGGWMKAAPTECIAGDAKKVLSACPGGTNMKRGGLRKNGAAFIESDSSKDKKTKPADKPKDDLKAERPTPQLSQKIETALMTEIVALEEQLKKTKVGNDKHVALARRLAESYYELERMKESEALDLTTQIANAERRKDPNAPALRTKRDKANNIRDKSQERVVYLYRLIVDKHKDYPKDDEVLYYLAYEFESQKATDPNDKTQLKREREAKEKALATYIELVKTFPKSKYVSAAYIAFGDLYFEEALAGRAEWAIPLDAYDRVIKAGPPPENKQWMYAQYKKGFIYWNLGQYKDAVTAFKSSIDMALKYPEVPKAGKIADEARKELIPVYAEYGKAEEAYGFFQSINAGNKEKTIGALDRLGEEYLARAHPTEAKKLFTELKGYNPGNACFYDTRITEAVINISPKDKVAIKAQLAMLTRGFMTYSAGANPDEKKLACGNQTAWLLSEHAIAWEYEALGDVGCINGQPNKEEYDRDKSKHLGTCNKDTIASAIDVFELILKNFKSFDGYKFNTKRPEDAPSIPKIKYSYADLLYGQGYWEKCGPAFDEVVAMDPNGAVAGDAAFAAVLCYDQEYNKKYKEKEKATSGGSGSITKQKVEESARAKNTPQNLDVYQSKMIGAFDRFVCYIKPDSSAKSYADDLEKLIEIKHQRAFLYFDGKHWDEAAEAFREIAMTYPDTDTGPRDAEMYMEALARIYMYADPARSCGNYMGDEVDKLIGLYCDKNAVASRVKDKKKVEELLSGTANLCDRLHASKADLDGIKALDLVKAEKFEEAADRFTKLADDVCTGALAKSQAELRATEPVVKPKKGGKEVKEELNACETRADSYLYNAALNYQRASKIKRAMDIRENKILGHKSWKDKETFRMTMFDLAEDYRRIALYGKAASYYEAFAGQDPNITSLLELATDKIEKEKAAHPEKYSGKKTDDVAKEYTEEQRASALSNAVVLRLGLGQEEEAIRNSEVFDRRFGAKRKEQARQIFLAIGEHYVVREEWVKGAERLDKFIKNYPDSRLDEKLHARALAGRAYRALKQANAADSMYGTIRTDWGKGRDKMREDIEKAAKENAGNSKIRENAYSAVAEAYVYFADKDYVKAQAVPFPSYRGNGDLEDIQKYFKGKFVDYLKARGELNTKAFEGYQKVICLGEEFDPAKGCTREWRDYAEQFASKAVVEASSKAGELWADTYDKAREAPVSNDLTVQPGDDKKMVTSTNQYTGKTETRSIKDLKLDNVATYKSQFDIAAKSVQDRAKAAYGECLSVSTKAKFFDQYSERCEKWLSANFKQEYRRMDELRPGGGLVGTGLKDRAFLVDAKLIPFDVSTRK